MAKTLAMVQDNDPVAEPLTSIASVADGEEDVTFTDADFTGSLKVHSRKIKYVAPPADAEELRTRYKVMENALLYAQFKNGSVAWLRDFHRNNMAELADYLLGAKCMKLPAIRDSGRKVSWSTILKYEYQIRKRAMEFVKENGLGLATALRRAMADDETRSLHFNTYNSMNNKRTRNDSDSEAGGKKTKKYKKTKGAGKGDKDHKAKGGWKGKKDKTKGAGKGKRKGGFTIVSQTPDRQLICYGYNDEGKTCDGSCGMLHVCRVVNCHDTHPMYEHKGWKTQNSWGEA